MRTVLGFLISFVFLQLASAADAVAVKDGVATISSDNAKITFVGTHSGDKPDPRTGGFGKFSGKVTIDPATKALTGVTADIDTTSLFTGIEKLTDHLKSADFFEVREHPTAKFESTKITAANTGHTITGKLTLHGVTKEISFPATVTITDDGVQLKSEFAINRSEFGMTYGAGKVDDKVSMTVVVGEKTKTN